MVMNSRQTCSSHASERRRTATLPQLREIGCWHFRRGRNPGAMLRRVSFFMAILVVRFVLLDFPVYFLRVPLHVAPGIEQISGLERGVVAQDFFVAGTEPAP